MPIIQLETRQKTMPSFWGFARTCTREYKRRVAVGASHNVCGQAGLRCECSLVRMADRKHPNLGTKLNLLPNSVSGGEFRMHARNREVTFAVLDTK